MDETFKIISFLHENKIAFQENIDLKTKTWIKRGGIARIWVQPDNLPEFEKLISWSQLNSIKFEVIGNTSNCYFLNDYHPFMVISTLKLNSMIETGDEIICDCGYNMSRLAKQCIAKGIAGYEGFIGLPGTVAGAAINNAGCYGSLTSKVLKGVTLLQDGIKIELTNQDLNYIHRSSALKSKEIDGVVTKVVFDAAKKGNAELMKKKAAEYQEHRKRYQEHTYPNLGTTFCHLELKYSLAKRILNAGMSRAIHYLVRSKLLKQQLRVKLFWILNKDKNGIVKNYVSKHNIQCFVWKDEGADKAFFDYVDFLKRTTSRAIIEIDIKK